MPLQKRMRAHALQMHSKLKPKSWQHPNRELQVAASAWLQPQTP